MNNRVFRLLTGQSRFDGRLVIGGIAVSAIAYLVLPVLSKRTVFYGVWAALVISSAAAWLAAARLTSSALRRPSYQMLRLAALPPAEVVDGLLLTAAHRLRFLLGMLAGTAPLLIISAYLYGYQGAAQRCVAFVSHRNWAEIVREFGFTRIYRLPEPVRCVTPADARLLAQALAVAPVALALMSLLPLMTVLGVSWAFSRQKQTSRTVSIGLLLAAGLALAAALLVRLLSPALRAPVFCPTNCTYILPWPPGIPLELGLLPIFVLAFRGLRRLARRWVS